MTEAELIASVCHHHDVSLDDALCPGRTDMQTAKARRWLSILLRERGLSYPRIARALNLSSHSSIIFAIRTVTPEEMERIAEAAAQHGWRSCPTNPGVAATLETAREDRARERDRRRLELYDAIADARMETALHTCRRTPGRKVGAAPQKAVLMAIARMDGDLLTEDRIADKIGCCSTTVHRAMHALRRAGVIYCAERVRVNTPSRWRIELAELRRRARK